MTTSAPASADTETFTSHKGRVVRRPTVAESKKIGAVRAVLLERAPYYASALYDMIPLIAEGMNTFAVDAFWRWYIDDEILAKWTVTESATALEHEINHLLRRHAHRGSSPTVNHKIWNIAGDCEINDDLDRAGHKFAEGYGVTPKTYELPDDLLAEVYYERLIEKIEELRKESGDSGECNCDEPEDGESGEGCPSCNPGNGQGNQDGGQGDLPGQPKGCGSGAGGDRNEYEIGEDGVEARSKSQQDIRRTQVAKEMRTHAAKHPGTVPAGQLRWAEMQLTPPQVPWEQELAAFARKGIAAASGLVDYTNTRPSRRNDDDTYFRGAMARAIPCVAVVADTSGSMGDREGATLISEIDAIVRKAGITFPQLAVYAVDAQSTKAQKVRAVRQIEFVGGGGTDMTVGYQAAVENRSHRPHLVIILTDGFTPWPTVAMIAAARVPVLAIIIDSNEAMAGDPPAHIAFHRILADNVTKSKGQRH